MQGILWATLSPDSVVLIRTRIPQVGQFVRMTDDYAFVKHHHMTLQYGVEAEMWRAYSGMQFKATVNTVAMNFRAIAIPVLEQQFPVDCSNAVPHITWALATGSKPVSSNDMLADPYRRVIEFVPLQLEFTIEFFAFR